MDQRPSSKESRRTMVQGRMSRSNRENGAQANLHTSPPRYAGIRAPWDQQDIPVSTTKVLVAEYATRREGLRTGMRGVSTT